LKHILSLMIAACLAQPVIADTPLTLTDKYPVLNAATDQLVEVLTKFNDRVELTEITPLPESGLISVVTKDKEILYLSESGRFLVTGDVIDLKDSINLTQHKKAQLNKVPWDTLPWENSFSSGVDDAPYELAVFTDVDCPYCKSLERDVLAFMPDVKIHYFMFPIPQLHPNAQAISVDVMCSDDPEKALHQYMASAVVPAVATDANRENCQRKVTQTMAFADNHGMTGTPTLVFKNGYRIAGKPDSPNELRELLKKAAAGA